MKGFVIWASHETLRQENVDQLCATALFSIERVEAIYATKQHIPFLDKLVKTAFDRTGYPMTSAELACLLSHRKVWQLICKEKANEEQHFLILESDSVIKNPEVLRTLFKEMESRYDLFFWGGYEGRIKLFHSTLFYPATGYKVGAPFVKTLYCAYGYSMNKKTAQLLLEKTASISYPVDHFKRYFGADEIRIGSILPEVITGNQLDSNIPQASKRGLFFKIFLKFIEWRNILLTRFG